MLIHIGITIEPAIKDYWKDLNTHGSLIFLSTGTELTRDASFNDHLNGSTTIARGPFSRG
jgi:hypothetical protein